MKLFYNFLKVIGVYVITFLLVYGIIFMLTGCFHLDCFTKDQITLVITIPIIGQFQIRRLK